MPKLVIDGVIGWDITANFVREFLNKNENKDITVEISSPGGLVFEGITIYNLLKAHKGKVTTHNISLAASMASVIALSGDVVKANDNAAFMIHNAMSFAIGDHNEMRKTADLIEALTNLVSEIYVAKTGKSSEEIHELMNNETWLFGDEIKEAGFADEIIKSEKKKDKQTALLDANLRIKNCINLMEESKRSKNDIKKVAALLNTDDYKNNLITVKPQIDNQGQNATTTCNNSDIDNDQNKINMEVKKNMTPEQIKNQYPEAYNSIFASGVESINEDIQAHAEWYDVDPTNVMESIKNNVPYTKKIRAKYEKAAATKKDINAHAQDNANVGDINIPSKETGNKATMDSFKNALSGYDVQEDYNE